MSKSDAHKLAEEVLELDDRYQNPFDGLDLDELKRLAGASTILATALINAEAAQALFQERMQDLRDENGKHVEALDRRRARELAEAQKRIAELEAENQLVRDAGTDVVVVASLCSIGDAPPEALGIAFDAWCAKTGGNEL